MPHERSCQRIPTVAVTTLRLCWLLALLVVAARVPADGRADLDMLQPDKTLAGHTLGIHAVAFFPDSRRVATAGHDKTVRTWDAITGRPLKVMSGHSDAVNSLAVSDDGKWIASGSLDRTVRVWDADTGDQIALFEGHTAAVQGVAFLPGGRLLSGGHEGVLRLWDVKAEKELWRTEPDDCVVSMAASADGKYGAYGDCDGVVHLFDLNAHQLLRKISNEKLDRGVIAMAFSADGKTLYASPSGLMTSYDVATGAERKLHLPSSAGFGEFALTRDDALLVDANGVVTDFQTRRHVCTFFEGGQCFAISPDHRRAVAAAVGKLLPGIAWRDQRQPVAYVFVLPSNPAAAAAATSAQGKPSGVISWDALDPRVRRLDGSEVAFSSRTWESTAGFARLIRHWSTCAAQVPGPKGPYALDLIACSGAVFLQRAPGHFQEVVSDRKDGYGQAVFDGTNFFVASKAKGILVIDPQQGRVRGAIGSEQGMMKADDMLALHVLGPGRLFVVGSCNDRRDPAWCGVVTVNPGGDGGTVKVIFRESDLPGDAAHRLAVMPLYVTEPPSAAGKPREIWVICANVSQSPQPILRFVEAEPWTYTAWNLIPEAEAKLGVGGNRDHPAALGYNISPRVWLSDHEVLGASAREYDVLSVDAGAPYISYQKRQIASTVLNRDGAGDQAKPVLPYAGQLYIPGPEWHRIDPTTRRGQDIGPGLRSGDGAPIRDNIDYFVSAHWGLAAISSVDKRLYRISADPAKPLTNRATRDAGLAVTPVEPGVVEYDKAGVTFRCGWGDLTFRNGHLLTDGRWNNPAVRHRAAEAQRHAHPRGDLLSDVFDRLATSAEERQRLGVTDEQFARVRTAFAAGRRGAQNGAAAAAPPDGAPALDRGRLDQLFATFNAAPDDAARQKAAEPLFAEAKGLGEVWVKQATAYYEQCEAVLTPEQWDALLEHRPE